MRYRILLACVAVALTIAYLAAEHQIEDGDRRASLTVYGDAGANTSILRDLLAGIARHPALIRKGPLLNARELTPGSALVLVAPLAGPTSHEVRELKSFVENGGELIVSFHDGGGLARLEGLLKAFKAPVVTREDSEFTNGTPVLAEPGADTRLFRTGERYAFYSRLLLESAHDCPEGKRPAGCYARVTSVGKGELVVFAGIPPLANGLIAQGANRRIAYRMSALPGPIAIDEYHHLFSDRGLGDLVREWRVSVPLGLLVLAGLLFFAFGHNELYEAPAPREGQGEGPRRGYHELGEGLLRGVLDSPGGYGSALERHRRHLARVFGRRATTPRAGDAAGNRAAMLAEAGRLLEEHQAFLNDRRGRASSWDKATLRS